MYTDFESSRLGKGLGGVFNTLVYSSSKQVNYVLVSTTNLGKNFYLWKRLFKITLLLTLVIWLFKTKTGYFKDYKT